MIVVGCSSQGEILTPVGLGVAGVCVCVLHPWGR